MRNESCVSLMKRNLKWNADCQKGVSGTSRDASHGLCAALVVFYFSAQAGWRRDQLTASAVLCSGAFRFQGHTTNHARGASLWLDTPDISKVMRSAFPSVLVLALPPSRVHYVLNSLLGHCISGLLSLQIHRADALHFETRSLNLSTNPVQLSSHKHVANSSSVVDTSGTAVLNTQKLRQVVRMSRDDAVHVNVSFM